MALQWTGVYSLPLLYLHQRQAPTDHCDTNGCKEGKTVVDICMCLDVCSCIYTTACVVPKEGVRRWTEGINGGGGGQGAEAIRDYCY